MSSALAIAAVTAVLRDLLNNGLIDHDVVGSTGGNVTVSVRPPDRVFPSGGQEGDQLNLFMHQITRNTGWTNNGLPSRDRQGRRITNPPLALDLHYLLTAYGSTDLHAEILLGYGMQVLHETPILTPPMIERALGAPEPVDSGILPPALQAVSASDLANQLECVRISPSILGSEEMSKLWASTQTSYRPTAAYQASVVLIESRRPGRAAVPVLQRGPTVDPVSRRDRGVVVSASLALPYPTIERAEPPNDQLVLRMGEELRLSGHHLDATDVLARFVRSDRPDELLDVAALAAPQPTPAGFSVELPDPADPAVGAGDPADPDSWRVGVYMVAAILRESGDPDRLSNTVAVTLAPTITTLPLAAPVVDGAAGSTTFTVECSPRVWRGQRARLMIGSVAMEAEPLAADPTDSLTFVARTDRLPAGEQRLRLQVDGVNSVLIDRSDGPPRFHANQVVVL